MNPILYQSIPFQNRREIRLLLLCARRSLDWKTEDQIRSLSNEDIDWQYLIKIASLHKLPFLLHHNLSIACPDIVTNPILKQLETRYLRNVAYSHRITRQLFEFIDLLGDHGIQAMPFKGPVLSELAYGDLFLRPIGDLDLLVDRKNASKSIDLFIGKDFLPDLDLDHDQFSAYADKKNSMTLYNPVCNLYVDLHWEMTNNYSFEPLVLSRMKKDLYLMTMDGKTILQPRVETLLVYLCLNGTRDGWKDMESVSSISGLISGYDNWDWARVIQIADRLRCKRMVLLGLVLARDLFNTDLPPDILKAVADDPVVLNLASEVCKYLFFKKIESDSLDKMNSKFSTFHFRVRDRWAEKLHYTKHLLLYPTAQDWHRFSLPARLSFLHTLLRPLRLSMTFFAQRSVIGGQRSGTRGQRSGTRGQRSGTRGRRAEIRG